MARNRRGNAQQIQTSVELVKVVAHTQGHKTVYRGTIKHDNTEYFFTANRKCIPVVLGAPSIEIMKETAKALNNWHKANKRGGQFYEDIEKLFNCAEIKLYTKEMTNGVFMLKNSAGYMGYLPGAAGIRAVYMNHKDNKPYSCALKSWSKLIDNNEAKPFRQMASQGQKIKEEMIPELMRIKAILDKQTNKPDPNGPGSKTKEKPQTTKEETKPEPQPDTRSEVQIEKEQQQTTTRRRRRTTGYEADVNPHTNKTTVCYCGSCNKDTEQEIITESEVQCLECGSSWEYFPEETKEETVIETVQEEMEQAMNEEMKKVEEQVKEELEQRSTRRRTRRTNEDVHNKETNEEPVTRLYVETEDNTYQDNCSDEIPSNTNDVSNIQSNDESTEDDGADDYDDIEYDIDADEAGDSFEVEAGILW